MYQLILLVHIFAAICIVALVLVQQGKGATMGAAFGSGASQTVFGSRGSGSFLFRVTMGFAVIFFVTSIGLNYIVTRAMKQSQTIALPVAPVIPARNTVAPVVTPQQAPAATQQTTPVVPGGIPTRQ